MSRKNIILSLFLITITSCIWGQFSLAINGKIDRVKDNFRVDELGYYTFFDHDMIEKLDTNGTPMFRQSVKMYGKIDCIDVSSPMKPLVFFQEQQAFIFLDNTLTPYQRPTRMSDLGVSYGTLICYSNQSDRFWIYDQDNSKLTLYLNDGRKHIETDNLAGILDIQNPIQLLERNGFLYLVDEHSGVFVFDMFGTFIDFFKIPTVEWIQAGERNIYYIQDGKLWSLNRKTRQTFYSELNGITSIVFQYSKKRFYFSAAKEIIVCEIQEKISRE